MGNTFALPTAFTYAPTVRSNVPADYEPTVISSDRCKVTINIAISDSPFSLFNNAYETRTLYVPRDQVSAVVNDTLTAAFTTTRKP